MYFYGKKTIGIIGPIETDVDKYYYDKIDGMYRQGGYKKPIITKITLVDVDSLMKTERWSEAIKRIVSSARILEQEGVDCIVLCTSTMHRAAEAITNAVSTPLLHIADATANQIKMTNIEGIGLIGTRPTVGYDFYKGCLEQRGFSVLISPKEDISKINYEITRAFPGNREVEALSLRQYFRKVVEDLLNRGAEGIIFDFPELDMVLKNTDYPYLVPRFDATSIHAKAALDFALQD